nr:LamG-like jellyroll fold domain-containing protein [Herbiconiux sp. KACC 21604]
MMRRIGRWTAIFFVVLGLFVGGGVTAAQALPAGTPAIEAEVTSPAEDSGDHEGADDPADPVPSDEPDAETTDGGAGDASLSDDSGVLPDPQQSDVPDPVEAVDPGPAEDLPAPPPKPEDANSAGTESDATRIAVAYGHNVVVEDQTTETTLVEALPDGTYQLTSSSMPVRVEQDESWVDIDTTLESSAEGYLSPAATTVPVRFSDGGTGPIAQVQLPTGVWFSESWELGPLPTPTVDGASATYGDVIPDVDLRLTATSTGMSEVLIINTPEAAADPDLAALKVKVAGATLAATEDGGAVAAEAGTDGLPAARSTGASALVDEVDPETMLRASEPRAWDSSAAESGPNGPGGNATSMPIDGTISGGHTLTVDVAAATTEAGDVTYPVYVDPDWTAGNIHAWTINRTYPTRSQLDGAGYVNGDNSQEVGFLAAGWTNPPGGDGREQLAISFWQMGIGPTAGKHIIRADFNVTETWSSSCAAREVQLYRSTNPGAGANWNQSQSVQYFGPSNQSSDWPNNPLDTVNVAKSTQCASSPPGPVGFDATAGVAAIAAANQPEIVLALRAAHEDDTYSWKRFNLGASLIIKYNSPPSNATSVSFSSPSRVCGTSAAPVGVSAAVGLTTKATVTDPDGGDTVGALFRVKNLATGQYIYNYDVTDQPQGVISRKIDANTLPQNGHFVMEVWAHDKLEYSPNDVKCYFDTDSVAPAAPTVSVPSAPGVVGKPLQNVVFSSSPSDRAGVFGYLWGDTQHTDSSALLMPPTFPAGTTTTLPACGTASGNITFVCPNSSGVATLAPAPIDTDGLLWVMAYDRAGNRSPLTSVAVSAAADTTNIKVNGGPGHQWNVTEAGQPLPDNINDVNTATSAAPTAGFPINIGAGFTRAETSTVPGKLGPRPVLSFDGYSALHRVLNSTDHALIVEGILPTGYNGYALDGQGSQLGQAVSLLTSPTGEVTPAPSGMKIIYSCFLPGGDDMTSTDPNCEGTGITGTALAYIWSGTGTNGSTAPTGVYDPKAIYRCRVGSDHFVSISSTCEGQTFEKRLGWLTYVTAVRAFAPAVNTVNSFTVSAWVKPSDLVDSSRYHTILSQSGTATSSAGTTYAGFYLQAAPVFNKQNPTLRDGVRYRFCVRSQVTFKTDCAVSNVDVADDTWVFVTGIWDSVNKQMRIIQGKTIQGAESHTPATNEINANGQFTVGSSTTNSARTNMWNGYIANPSIFPGVASLTQIDNLSKFTSF